MRPTNNGCFFVIFEIIFLRFNIEQEHTPLEIGEVKGILGSVVSSHYI